METMSDTTETDQLEECDQYKVDEDYAEYNAYRRMVEHARQLERERDKLADVIKASTILIAAKGRHNTMLAYEGLRQALQSIIQPTKL